MANKEQKRSKKEAEDMAHTIAAALFEMSREDFIAFARFSKGKKTTNQIVSDWSAFDGAELSMGAVSQFGMFNPREN